MCKRNILTIVAVAILALALGQVQAVTVTVPNSGFELMYKPGTTIRGVISDNRWTMGVGPACPIDSGQYIFDDGSTGDEADIPGWLGYDRQGWIDAGGTYGRDETTGNLQGSLAAQVVAPEGLYYYLSNGGGWGNAAGGLIVSEASLGKVKGGIYTLSMLAAGPDGPATPVVLELLAGGVVVPPTSSVDPVPSADWQEYSRTYDFIQLSSYVGQAMTIVLGVDRGAAGAQSHFDNVSLSYEHVIQASEPTPGNEATDVYRSPILGWMPGIYADTHDVYFGESFDDVNDAGAGSDLLVSPGQDANTYDPGRLDFGQTYYWRVDEANGAPDYSLFAGQVWSFTVEPIAIPVESVTATASSSSADNMGPENTINGVGLNELDQHSTEATEMWLSGVGDPTPSIQYEFDKAYKLHEMWVWNSNQVIESFLGIGAKDVVIETSVDGTEWVALEGPIQLAQAPGQATYTANTAVDFGAVLAKYVKITVNTGYGLLPQYGLSQVRFLYIPTFAREAQPADGETTEAAHVLLAWRAGREAAAHHVYLGTDAADLPLLGTADESRYDAGALDYASTYYWQIVEVNEAETPSSYAGPIWSFTTPAFGTVDSFDQYDDDCNRIFFAWEDGLGHNGGEEVEGCEEPASNGNGGGSIVGNASAPFAEKTIVYAGTQAMPLEYDNAFGQSEATLRLNGQDWTTSDVQTLALALRGTVGNTGTLYIKINNSKVVYDGDAADLAVEAWQVWNIDLGSVSGLQNVTRLTIGVDGASAAGMLYIDEIRLYPEVEQGPVASPGSVPNGDFESIFKPGSFSITADLGDGWTQGVGMDAPMDNGTALYSDGTSGPSVSIPGWKGAKGWEGTYDRDTNFLDRQGSVQASGADGSYAFLANGGDWGNPNGGLIESADSLGDVEDGTYTLAMVANGGATPVVLELLAGGVVLTPSSAQDPALTEDFQEFSRTYDATSLAGFLGEPLTIRLGVGRNAAGTQTRFDNVDLLFEAGQ